MTTWLLLKVPVRPAAVPLSQRTLVELDDQGEMWAGSFHGRPDAYGRAGDVIAALTSRPARRRGQ